jgi:hypothetical protein
VAAMGAIKNFGHFWNAQVVNRNITEEVRKGQTRKKGDLKGYSGRGKSKEIVDFRSQIGIYVLFAENREVIYVGQVGVTKAERYLVGSGGTDATIFEGDGVIFRGSGSVTSTTTQRPTQRR